MDLLKQSLEVKFLLTLDLMLDRMPDRMPPIVAEWPESLLRTLARSGAVFDSKYQQKFAEKN